MRTGDAPLPVAAGSLPVIREGPGGPGDVFRPSHREGLVTGRGDWDEGRRNC